MKILIFCAKGFETMEFSVFIDVMGWARNDYGYPVETETCGFNKIVNSTFNVSIAVDNLVENVSADDYDALAIPGGFEEFGFYDEAYNHKFLQLIRDFDSQKKANCFNMCGCFASGEKWCFE